MKKKAEKPNNNENIEKNPFVEDTSVIEDTPATIDKEELQTDIVEEKNSVTVSFKKTFYGFDPKDVLSYIEEQNETYIKTCSRYDSRIEEFKTNLTLVNRERDSLLEREKSVLKRAEAAEDELFELKEYVEQTSEKAMNEQRQKFESEITSLSSQLNNAQAIIEKLSPLEKEYNELKKESDELNLRLAEYKQENEELNAEMTRLRDIEKQEIIAKDELEKIRLENNALKQKLTEAQNDVEVKTTAVNRVLDEKEQMQQAMTELETKNKILEEQQENYLEETSSLRESARKQMVNFAQKKTELETQFSSEKLKLIKQIQVHSYHIKQSKSLLDELKKQFEFAVNSFNEIESE